MSEHLLLLGDALQQLKTLDDNSMDSLVTDPPAGISFMAKAWDDDKGGRKQWIDWMSSVMKEAIRVLKPGAHGLVWAIPRTSHRTATALENAGFEIRDVVTHLFGSGFPKSMDISKAIDKQAGAERVQGALKFKGGTQLGVINDDSWKPKDVYESSPATEDAKVWQGWGTALKPASEHWILVRKPTTEKTVAANVLKFGTGGINIDESRIGDKPGRFPANLVLDEEAAKLLDEQSGHLKTHRGASRFFYVAKASKKDKGEMNTHPTVKSRVLMTYLIKLITPPSGIVLDPFMGSGSTGVAAKEAGFSFVGIEKEKEYFDISDSRISEIKEAA